MFVKYHIVGFSKYNFIFSLESNTPTHINKKTSYSATNGCRLAVNVTVWQRNFVYC